MGVERAVTRWYAQRQVLIYEIASLEAKLAQIKQGGQAAGSKEQNAVEEQLATAQAKLRASGPCPRPMMG
ncbi:MAG TPA: hypothetical protein VF043_06900 [Ktedonobacteraceae bacterium]